MRNRKLVGALAVLAATQGIQSVHAELLYDGFSYGVGTLTPANPGTFPTDTDPRLNGNAGAGDVNPYGVGWYGAGSYTNDVQITGTGLTAPTGLQPAVGNTAELGVTATTGNAARIAIGPFGIPSTGSTTVYYSMLVDVTNTAGLSATNAGSGNPIAGFNTVSGSQPNVPSVVGARLLARKDANTNTYEFGFAKNADTTGLTQWDAPDTRNQGQTYFVVGSYTLQGTLSGGTDDTASMWINPDSSTFGAATPPSATFTDTTSTADLSTGRIESLILRQFGTASGTLGFQIDEVRVDTSWAGVTPQAGTTVSATGGNWSDPGTWQGAAPDAANAVANLRSATPVTVTSDGAGHNVNAIYFNGPITLNGSAPVTFNNGSSMNVEAGSPTVSAPISLNSDMSIDVAVGNTLSLTNSQGLTSSTATVRKAGDGTVAVDHVNLKELDVYRGTVKLTGNTSVVNTLGVPQPTNVHYTSLSGQANTNPAPWGTVDIGTGTLVVDYSGTSPQVSTVNNPSVLALIKFYGYSGGAWTGTGLTSSAAAADSSKSTGIGYAENSALGLSAYDSTAVIARYTYYGDANLDGTVNALDFNAFATNYGQNAGSSVWVQGDFNYDGSVDSNDFALLAANYNKSMPSMGLTANGLGAEVPEPASLGVLGLASLGLIGRRRRMR